MKPIISTVIPTRNRPLLVERAVKSAIAQTFQEIEVIVIIDGSDAATRAVLTEIDDPRLKFIELPIPGGAAAARNAGVFEAAGEWIAFLDDDDEWLPEKIERQLEVAHKSHYVFPVVASRVFARSSKGELIWPRRLPNPSEPIEEYLFVRNSFFSGEGFIQTSTFLTKRELLINIPLGNSLNKHQDWDWLLRVSALEGVGIEFVPEPLAIWYAETGRKRISNINDWQYSLEWILSVRHLVTARAYSAFITTVVSSQAANEGDWKAFFPLLGEVLRTGQPRQFDILLYVSMWLMPQNLRHKLRYLLTKDKKYSLQQNNI